MTETRIKQYEKTEISEKTTSMKQTESSEKTKAENVKKTGKLKMLK